MSEESMEEFLSRVAEEMGIDLEGLMPEPTKEEGADSHDGCDVCERIGFDNDFIASIVASIMLVNEMDGATRANGLMFFEAMDKLLRAMFHLGYAQATLDYGDMPDLPPEIQEAYRNRGPLKFDVYDQKNEEQ